MGYGAQFCRRPQERGADRSSRQPRPPRLRRLVSWEQAGPAGPTAVLAQAAVEGIQSRGSSWPTWTLLGLGRWSGRCRPVRGSGGWRDLHRPLQRGPALPGTGRLTQHLRPGVSPGRRRPGAGDRRNQGAVGSLCDSRSCRSASERMTGTNRESKQDNRLWPLTCGFAPLAGLEPAPYGLEVDPSSSRSCCRVPFSLVRSGGSSSRYSPVMRCCTWRNDQRNDQTCSDVCHVDRSGARRSQFGRLDDQRDDQVAFDLGSSGTGSGGSLEACEKAKPLTGTWLEETWPRRFLIVRRFGR